MKNKKIVLLLSSLISLCSCSGFNLPTSHSSSFINSELSSSNEENSFSKESISSEEYSSEVDNTSSEESIRSEVQFSSEEHLSSSSLDSVVSSSSSEITSSSSSEDQRRELLKDTSFDALTSWNIFATDGCTFTSLSHGNGNIQLLVNNATAREDWSVQFLQNNFILEQNETYHVSFKMKSNVSRKIIFRLQTMDYSDSPINETISLTANSEYDYQKDILITRESSYLFGFMLGKIEENVLPNDHQITLSNVSLKGKQVSSSEENYDGTYDAPLQNKHNRHLVWNDEFNDHSLDMSKWSYELGTGSWGWGNNEQQYYTNNSKNIYESNGSLKIVALKEEQGGMHYTSSRIITKDKYEFHYGYVEARLSLPSMMGIWPAFWLLCANIDEVSWPFCGEIDVMEAINMENKVHSTLHFNNNGHQSTSNNGYILNTRKEYHIYAFEWDENHMKFYVDDVEVFSQNLNDNSGLSCFKKDFYFLLNVAVGGNWPGFSIGDDFPSIMSIDYLRVYQ